MLPLYHIVLLCQVSLPFALYLSLIHIYSERTIETYCQSLNAFRIYLYETYSKTVDQITIDFVTEDVIREFLSSVADSNRDVYKRQG